MVKSTSLLEIQEGGYQEWPFDQPFHLILNIAVGGNWGGQKGVAPDIWPQKMEIDYVRVYDAIPSKED
jgi:beta-glucanase (GH16 family)